MSTIIRLYVQEDLSSGASIDLPAEQAHYINNVMRMNVGDSLRLFNGRDGEWAAEITGGKKKRCTVSVAAQTRNHEEPVDLWLVFAPIKKQHLDNIIEKATELGIATLQPVITRRTVVSKVRTDRFQAQAVEASEQCERVNVPDIRDACSLEQLLQDWPEDRTLFVLDETGQGLPINKALLNETQGVPSAFITGPEGGFDPSELELLNKKPFVKRVCIGPRILRADTAGLAAISCWQSILGDWQANPSREN